MRASPLRYSGVSSTSRTFRTSESGVNGFWRKATPGLQDAVLEDGVVGVSGHEKDARCGLPLRDAVRLRDRSSPASRRPPPLGRSAPCGRLRQSDGLLAAAPRQDLVPERLEHTRGIQRQLRTRVSSSTMRMVSVSFTGPDAAVRSRFAMSSRPIPRRAATEDRKRVVPFARLAQERRRRRRSASRCRKRSPVRTRPASASAWS